MGDPIAVLRNENPTGPCVGDCVAVVLFRLLAVCVYPTPVHLLLLLLISRLSDVWLVR